MKTCGECGAGYEDHMEVCLIDGEPLVRDAAVQAVPEKRVQRPRLAGWMVALAFLPALTGLVAIVLLLGVVAISTSAAEAARPDAAALTQLPTGMVSPAVPLGFLPAEDEHIEAPRSEQSATPQKRRRRRRVPRLNRQR